MESRIDGGPEEHEVLVAQIRRAQGLLRGQRMVDGQQRCQRLAGEQRLDPDSVVLLSRMEDAEVELSGVQAADLFEREEMRHLRIGVGDEGSEVPEEGLDALERQVQSATDPEDGRVRGAPCFGDGELDTREDGACFLGEDVTCRGRGDAPAGALEQPDPSAASSFRIAWERGGWAMNNRAAARPK